MYPTKHPICSDNYLVKSHFLKKTSNNLHLSDIILIFALSSYRAPFVGNVGVLYNRKAYLIAQRKTSRSHASPYIIVLLLAKTTKIRDSAWAFLILDMKKILLLMVTIALMLSQNIYAQNDLLNKALQKEYKTKMKEFKKGGWEIFGSSRSLDYALLNHYDKLNKGGDNVYEIVGIASAFKSKNIGRQIAMNNACVIYSSQAGSLIKGRVVSDMGADADNLTVEFDHFYAAYERAVEKEIRGEIKESFSIIRQNKDGSYEMQSFFIFDEDSALSARVKAFENAAKESVAAQKYADIIRKYINERVDPSEAPQDVPQQAKGIDI